ncbi:MAG: hypothetical protein KAJ11_12675 [Alphaproteobacteria bacterium]|nr:hypothetical protein [Alphaproteobacteria bacterium]
MTDRRDGVDDRKARLEIARLAVLVGAAVLAGEGVRHLGARVEGALDAASFLTGPGPDGLIEVAALPVLAVLIVLFFRRDIWNDRGPRLGAMGLGAGAGILLADPLARIALYLGLPGVAPTEESGVLRITINLLVLGVVAVLFIRGLIRELRRPGPKDSGPGQGEGDAE